MSKGTTNYFEVHGVIEWAKVFEQNRDKEGYKGAYLDTDGACTVDMLLDDNNVEILRKAGTAKNLDDKRKDTPNGYRVRLVRKFFNEAFPSLGGAPKVAHPDGTPWDLEMDGFIGNGSTGVAYGHVYLPDDGSPATTRLDGLQVIDHVVFESEGGGNIGGGPRFKDYSKKSDQKKSEPKVKPQVRDDDEIPF